MDNFCTLYIVRHGETDWNVKHLVQGHVDNPLNPNGKIQAHNLAKELNNIHFDKIISSDLLRAKQTAEIIALELKLAVETTAALKERRFGEIEGQSTQILHEIDKLTENLEMAERRSYKPNSEYESDEELWQRFATLLRETAVAYSGKTVLVVCHGGLLRTFVDHLVDTYNPQRNFPNGAYLVVESDGIEFNIKEAKGIEL